jgi:hypothetical protein
MPWAYPDSPDSYLRLLKAIDRKHFAAHLDPVNLVCSPQRYFASGQLIRECFEKLGPYIRSCHAAAEHIRGVARQLGLSFLPLRLPSQDGAVGI